MFVAAIGALAALMAAPQEPERSAPLPSITAGGFVIRDPFVLPVPEEKRYYLYGTASPLGELGFDAYSSTDLVSWEGPFPVFRPPEGFWADRQFWAPEVHRYRGKYYLFATFAQAHPVRGTQVCVSDSPRGPFVPLGDGSQTPRNWQCLDGTLFLDTDKTPWMVFCHEWTQVVNGEICAIQLSEDLARSVGKPCLLFRASDAPWVGEIGGGKRRGYVTDGVWLHRLPQGTLLMLWSSFNKKGKYCITTARSTSGTIDGPWEHRPEPIFSKDGGHPMIFRTFDGELLVSFHQPNGHPERLTIYAVEEKEDKVALVKWGG